MTALTLSFQETQFDVVDREGQLWLKGSEIAVALGYKSYDAISRIYRRNSDEFTDAMTSTVKLTVSGNLETETRIFSLRGAHLLAMFARTKVAKEFRKWVLDILDKEVDQNPAPKTEEEVMLRQLRFSRWMLTFGDAGTPFMKRIPDDACVMSVERLLEAINEPNGIYVSPEKLFAFVQATLKRLEHSYQYQKARAEGKPAKLRW